MFQLFGIYCVWGEGGWFRVLEFRVPTVGFRQKGLRV